MPTMTGEGLCSSAGHRLSRPVDLTVSQRSFAVLSLGQECVLHLGHLQHKPLPDGTCSGKVFVRRSAPREDRDTSECCEPSTPACTTRVQRVDRPRQCSKSGCWGTACSAHLYSDGMLQTRAAAVTRALDRPGRLCRQPVDHTQEKLPA